MKTFNFTIENELVLLEKYGITAEELFVIKLLFLAVEENQTSYLVRYLAINREGFRDILVSLQSKGVILKSYKIPNKGEKFDPSEIEYNKTL